MDISDMVDFNLDLLNENDLPNSFFCLRKDDPAAGFPFDASQMAGHAYGQEYQDQAQQPLSRRLILGNR